MLETLESHDIAEVGQDGFTRLAAVLEDREMEGYNSAGWEGTSAELRAQVNNNSLCSASAFAVVAEGLTGYRRQGSELRELPDSLRDFSRVLSAGSDIFSEAFKIDKSTLLDQVRNYVESHGGAFDASVDWQDLISERAQILARKADAFEEING